MTHLENILTDTLHDGMDYEREKWLKVIGDIRTELENRRDEIKEVDEKNKTASMKGFVLGLDRALEVIDRKVNEIEPEDNTRPYYANEWLDEGKVNEGDKCES